MNPQQFKWALRNGQSRTTAAVAGYKQDPYQQVIEQAQTAFEASTAAEAVLAEMLPAELAGQVHAAVRNGVCQFRVASAEIASRFRIVVQPIARAIRERNAVSRFSCVVEAS